MSDRALKRKLFINLALVVAAGALTAIVLLEPGGEPEKPLPPLTTLERDSVQGITIRPSDRPRIRIERADGGWRITDPRELDANAGKLDTLLAITDAVSQRSYGPGKLDPGAVGLDDDAPSLTLDGTTFTFGDTDPINGWRYVRIGNTVHLVNDRFIHLLEQPPLYWADNRLLPDGASISAIELPGRRIHRDQDGLWRIEPPAENVTTDALVSLVQRWESARGLSVQALEAEHPVADAPAIRVHLHDRGKPVTFRLLETGDGIFLARSDRGLRYAITEVQRDDLMQPEASAPAPGNGDDSGEPPEPRPDGGP